MAANDSILILGDFNLPGIRWTRHPSGYYFPDITHSTISNTSSQLLDDYSTANLGQLSDFRNSFNNVLDLCFASIDTPVRCSLLQAPLPLVKTSSSHCPFHISIECRTYAFRDVGSSVYPDYRNGNFRDMNSYLNNLNWNHLLSNRSANSAAESLSEALLQAMHTFIPEKERQPPSHPPWTNHRLKRLKSRKRAALRKYNKHRTDRWRSRYTTINHRYSCLNKRLYHSHQHRIQERLKRNPKQFWSHVNDQRRETGLPTVMIRDDVEASSIEGVCDLFRAQFSSVFTEETLEDDQVREAANTTPIRAQIGQHPPIDPETVRRACSKLKGSTSCGPDGIPAFVLKKCCDSLAVPLSQIFNVSLQTGIFPTCWKKSFIFPVHKKGTKRDVRNYRGIAALCAISKLFEVVVLDYIQFNCLNYIAPEQHGFMPKRSTCSNLTTYTSFISNAMQQRLQVDAIYTDLSAAFDKINHRIAIAKLERLGFCGSLLRWLHSYLSDREMCVKIGDVFSAAFLVFSGVPQGSHLGPLIYLLYMNDAHLLLNCEKLSYADDIKLFSVIQTNEDALLLQDQLNTFANWCTRNRMVLNASKCSVITFTRKRSSVSFQYKLSNTNLIHSSCVKDLGVMLDSKLTFKEHLSYTVSKASKTLGFIFRLAKNFTQLNCLKALYCSLVRSTLEYCSVVWAPYYQNGIQRIETVQRKFTRYALRHVVQPDPANPFTYEERCERLDLDLLTVRRDLAKAVFVADLIQSRIDCPAILQQVNFHIRRRSLRSQQFLRIPRAATNYGRNEVISSMCRIFNQCYTHFDFHLSRDALKKIFLNYLNRLHVA